MDPTLKAAIAPHEVMAGGLWTKDGIQAALQWQKNKDAGIAHDEYLTAEASDHQTDFILGESSAAARIKEKILS